MNRLNEDELRIVRESYEYEQQKYRDALEFMAENGARLDRNDIQQLYKIVEDNTNNNINRASNNKNNFSDLYKASKGPVSTDNGNFKYKNNNSNDINISDYIKNSTNNSQLNNNSSNNQQYSQVQSNTNSNNQQNYQLNNQQQYSQAQANNQNKDTAAKAFGRGVASGVGAGLAQAAIGALV